VKSLERELLALPPIQLWLVGHRALRDVPRVAAVWDFIVDEVGQDQVNESR
jgi:hypothetical protein